MLKRLLVTATLIALAFLAYSCSDNASGPGGDNGSEDPEPYSHTGQPGHAANDILSDDNYSELVIEIDYMPGYSPNDDALESLKQFLEQHTQKSVTIQEPTEIESGGQDSYTANEIRDLEDEHRDAFTEDAEGETLHAYMIIVDGEFEQENVLGIAYYNTSNAFFGEAYDQASGGTGQPSRFRTEATSFQHEFGHLFGLVNIDGSGTDMQEDHQDEENGHHCDNDQCLMYYAIESTDLFGSFIDGEVPELDENCVADIQANGGQ